MKQLWWLLAVVLGFTHVQAQRPIRTKVPEKLVVLTFDDAPVTHATVVAPLLKKYGFGATFYVCEFPPRFADKNLYMSWPQMAGLDKQGFEVANHTLRHKGVSKLTAEQLAAELDSLESRFRHYGIRHSATFAYPGYDTSSAAIRVLRQKGYRLARMGSNRPYRPATDSPWLIPSYTVTSVKSPHPPLSKILEDIANVQPGEIPVLTLHGVPDHEHPWVTTTPDDLVKLLGFLADHHYKVIALRDLETYLDLPKPK